MNWWTCSGTSMCRWWRGRVISKPHSLARLFFAVMPFAMLLLFVADNSLANHGLGCRSAGFGRACWLWRSWCPHSHEDRSGAHQLSYRFFLPLVAFAAFAATAFVEPPLQRSVMAVGSLSFCAIYALVMSAMLVAMAGRMRSLACRPEAS
ncbi:MAG: hypothetical protein ACLT98_09680 [Eggerthellaceae bacterium]